MISKSYFFLNYPGVIPLIPKREEAHFFKKFCVKLRSYRVSNPEKLQFKFYECL